MSRQHSVATWAKLYNAKHTTHREGFCRYTSIISIGRSELVVSNVCTLLAPSLADATRELRKRARVADAFGGSFDLWLTRQAVGRTMGEYFKDWEPLQQARDCIINTFGETIGGVLIWAKD